MARTIFHLVRNDDGPFYGQHSEHIVIAATEHDARLMAGRASRGENGIVWMEPSTEVQIIGTASNPNTLPRIVMSVMVGE